MQNHLINNVIYNAPFRNQVQTFLLRNARAYSKACKPDTDQWQWAVQRNPESTCKTPCVSKKCPKKSWFPRFRKVYVPKDVKACKEKKMTWGEYFSYLLPDKYQKPKPPLVTCRRLLMLRNEKCAAECSRECPPKNREWKGQAVVRTELSCTIPQRKPSGPKPCPPPSHVLPRDVMVKKGICPIKGKTDPEAHRIKMPYDEFKAAKMSLEALVEKPFQLRSSKVCKAKDPLMGDKSSKLRCRSYAGLKSVECPQQVYTRYKSVDIPPATCGELRPLRPVAASSFDLSKLRPKRGCSDRPKPQTRELHTFAHKVDLIETAGKSSLSEAIKKFDLQPAQSVFEVKKLIESRSFESAVKERPKRTRFVKPVVTVAPPPKPATFEEEPEEEEEVAAPKSSFDKSVQAFRSLVHHVEPYSSALPSPRLGLVEKQALTNRFIHKRRFSSKKHSGPPCKVGCSPTAQMVAKKEVKGKGKPLQKPPMVLKRDCKLNLGKECPCSPNANPNEIKAVNPYQAARKKPTLSVCNQPRKSPPSRPPCKKSLHTSAPEWNRDPGSFAANKVWTSVSDRLARRSLSAVALEPAHCELAPEQREARQRRAESEGGLLWSKAKGRDECREKKRKAFCEKKKEVAKEDDCGAKKCDEGKKKGGKFDPYSVKRESCFPKPKKNQPKKKGGVVCKIASIFGIGCGKKKPKGTC